MSRHSRTITCSAKYHTRTPLMRTNSALLLNQITDRVESSSCSSTMATATVSSTVISDNTTQAARRDTYNRTCVEREGVFLATFQRTTESCSPSVFSSESTMAYRPTSDVANKIAQEKKCLACWMDVPLTKLGRKFLILGAHKQNTNCLIEVRLGVQQNIKIGRIIDQ